MEGGPAAEILSDAGYQGLGAQTGGRVRPERSSIHLFPRKELLDATQAIRNLPPNELARQMISDIENYIANLDHIADGGRL